MMCLPLTDIDSYVILPLLHLQPWYVVIFTISNEIQHVPNTWLQNENVCWFPNLKKDGKEIFFTISQVSTMIKKCTEKNDVDGTNYDIKTVAGPFAARGTSVGESPLMSSDLISVSHGSSSISESNSKTSSTKLGPRLSETITESYSKTESTPRIMIKKKQESTVSHSSLTSSSTPIDNLKKTTTSNTELELLLVDTIIESNPNFEGSLMLLDGLQEINYRDSNVYDNDNFDSTLINKKETNNTNTTGSDLMDLSNFINKNENCCCQNLLQIKSTLATNEKTSKAVHKQMMIQLYMLNNSNVKIVNAMKNMDQKLQVIMKADSRMRSLALPIPALPTALITLLPAKCIEEVDVVESILSDDNDGLNNQEELKSYLYMKIGSMDSISTAARAAINECFMYDVLAFFSFKGKTKRSFSNLKLFTVIYESLSSFRTHSKDEEKFNRTVDNYIKHSKQKNEDQKE
ncbi:hypothetical protein ACI65C_013784 [Semiaphis heraclei]